MPSGPIKSISKGRTQRLRNAHPYGKPPKSPKKKNNTRKSRK